MVVLWAPGALSRGLVVAAARRWRTRSVLPNVWQRLRPRGCWLRRLRPTYVPQLLARYDQNLTFVQTWDGVPLSQKYPIAEFNKKFCELSLDYVSSGVDTNYWYLASPQRRDVTPMSAQVARFAKCATSVLRKARVEHLDSFDVATAAKNTVLHDGKLTSTAV